MKKVRAKFVVEKISKTRHNGHEIHLAPVSGDTEENKTFWKWTPAGKIEFYCINDEAVAQFEVGKEFYIDFIPAQ